MGVGVTLDLLEKHYDESVNEIRQSFQNIDVNLFVKTLAIERKWPNERLRFYLTISYKNAINMDMERSTYLLGYCRTVVD